MQRVRLYRRDWQAGHLVLECWLHNLWHPRKWENREDMRTFVAVMLLCLVLPVAGRAGDGPRPWYKSGRFWISETIDALAYGGMALNASQPCPRGCVEAIGGGPQAGVGRMAGAGAGWFVVTTVINAEMWHSSQGMTRGWRYFARLDVPVTAVSIFGAVTIHDAAYRSCQRAQLICR